MDAFAEWLLSPAVVWSVITLIATLSALALYFLAKDFKKNNCCPKCESWETDEVILINVYHVGADGLSVFFGTNHVQSSKHKRWCRKCGHVLVDELRSAGKLPEPAPNHAWGGGGGGGGSN